MNHLIITVDTEGDNLWKWHEGEPITTRNTTFIPRFQELCEKYGFIPTYLTNYEMAMDPEWVRYGGRKAKDGLCEIGMHLHAWNTPPDYELANHYGGNPYITEYPAEIIHAKIKTMVDLLSDRFELPITSNRSGRWATNEKYFYALVENGIKVDCSVTPGIDLSKIRGRSQNCGNDYRKMPIQPYEIVPGLLEIPMTTKMFRVTKTKSLKQFAKALIKGKDCWLRPLNRDDISLEELTETMCQKQGGYVEFMIHSSELMPGGSPYNPDANSIDRLYNTITIYFDYLTKNGFKGTSLSQYASNLAGEKTYEYI